MKITDIEVMELRVPGWQGLTFDGSYDNCVIKLNRRGRDGHRRSRQRAFSYQSDHRGKAITYPRNWLEDRAAWP